MTKLNSFCSEPNRRRTSLALSALTLLGAFVLVCAPPARAGDNAPDWMRAAACEKYPDPPKDAVAVVLLDDGQTTVKANGDIEYHIRRVYKLLRPEPRGDSYYNIAHVSFNNEMKIKFLKAWTIMPNGNEIEVKEKDFAEVSLTSFEVFSDAKAKLIKFPEANPGSVVGFEYIQTRRPFTLDQIWSFQEEVPVRRSRFTLSLPAGWEFTALWANHPEQKPEVTGSNTYVWEVLDSPAIELEPEMPPFTAVGVHMYVKFFPHDPNIRGKVTGSWKDIGAWDWSLIEPRRTVTPAIKEKVVELTSSLPNRAEKIKALAQFTQQQIRYAAIEIGIGGVQPHAAGDVFAHRYGDCKDKATLLNTMLQEIGVSSYNVIINTRRGVTRPEFPGHYFDHAILAIQLPDDVEEARFYAVIKHPTLGRLLFFDPTDERVPLGYLPSELQDSYGLVVTPQGGELVATPLLPPSTNRLLRTASLDLSAAGNLTGEIKEIRWGGPAEQSRSQLLELPPAKRSKVFEELLGSSLGNFTLTNATVGNLEKNDESLLLNYKFFAEGYAKRAGDLLVVRPRVVGQKGSSILSGKPRKYPIEFHEATRQDDQIEITLPSGYAVDELPEPVKAECAYGTYKSEVKVDGNKLHYNRTYEIRDIYVPTQKLAEVKDFFQQIAADEHSSAVLRRAN